MKAHRNLRSLKVASVSPWSFYADGIKRVQHAEAMTLHGVTMRHPSGVEFDRCRGHDDDGNPVPCYTDPRGKTRGRERAVFAWFDAESHTTTTPAELPAATVRVRLNPFTDAFFHDDDGIRIDSARTAYLLPDGTALVVL
jgi:hypothetical protein